MNNNIGIFAGTFDPIHNGHLAVAKLSLQNCFLDTVYFAVEAEPWGLKSPVGIKMRREMVDLTIESEQGMKQLILPDKHFEINKTLPYLEKQFKDQKLFFIFGADVFLKMNSSSWPSLIKLLKHHLIIFERAEISENDISNHAIEIGASVAILTSEHLKSSSTTIRKLNLRSEDVPEKIKNYLIKNRLYID